MSDSLWIERLEAVEAEIKALKASWAPAEFVSLRDRVRELEGGAPRFACVSGFTPGSEGPRHEYVECSELARLRKLEAAARRYCDHTAALPCYGADDQREWRLLRTALGDY